MSMPSWVCPTVIDVHQKKMRPRVFTKSSTWTLVHLDRIVIWKCFRVMHFKNPRRIVSHSPFLSQRATSTARGRSGLVGSNRRRSRWPWYMCHRQLPLRVSGADAGVHIDPCTHADPCLTMGPTFAQEIGQYRFGLSSMSSLSAFLSTLSDAGSRPCNEPRQKPRVHFTVGPFSIQK